MYLYRFNILSVLICNTRSMNALTKLLFISSCVFLFSGNAHSQTRFSKVYYDLSGAAQASAIVQCPDNGYMVAGQKDDGILFAKMDSSGGVLWSKKIFSGAYSNANTALTSTKDACFVLAGTCFDTVTEKGELLCVKINANGDTLWTSAIEAGGSAYANSIEQTADDGFIVAGHTWQSSGAYYDMVVAKLAANGQPEWVKIITGGNNENIAFNAKQLPDGGYVAVGMVVNYPVYTSYACLMKLTPAGEISWTKKYHLPAASTSSGYDLDIEPDGILVCLNPDHNNGNVHLMKTDFDGNILWSKQYSTFFGWNFSNFISSRISKTSDGGHAIITAQGAFKTDAAGNVLWSNFLMFYGINVIESKDGGYLFLGNGPMIGVKNPGTGLQFGFIKTDSLGNGGDCIWPEGWSSVNGNIISENMTMTILSNGIRVPASPEITPTVLSWEDGCVAFIGKLGESERAEQIKVYPNPTSGIFSFETSGKDKVSSVEVYNLIGDLVFHSNCPTSNPQTIDLHEQPNGIYYLKVKYADRIASQKVVISH